MKIELGLESHSPAKRPFLTAFSQTYGPTKIEDLGTCQASTLFRNLGRFFCLLYTGDTRVTMCNVLAVNHNFIAGHSPGRIKIYIFITALCISKEELNKSEVEK